MAEAARDELEGARPDVRALLERAAAPWLAPVRDRLAAMHDRERVPHGILLAGRAGGGQDALGAWLAARLLCRAASDRPCATCADCRLTLAGNHPDLYWLDVLPDKKEIAIEQVRKLTEALGLRSYRGGAKVAVVATAEAMNTKSFNALLKTLEEPSRDSFLVLATARVERTPRTILSRCLRLSVPLPAPEAGRAWLDGRGVQGDAEALLALAGGAPFLAETLAAEGLGTLDGEMRDLVAAAVSGRLDVVAAAEACAGEAPAARLTWLESWLIRSLKEAALSSDAVNNNRLPWLRPPGAELKIRAGHRLLDRLRDARRSLDGPLNKQLLFEELLGALAALVGPPRREGD